MSHRTAPAPLLALLLATACATPGTPGAPQPVPKEAPSVAPGDRAASTDPVATFEADCAEGRTACRRDVKVTLRRERGPGFEQTFRYFPPVLQPAFMTILPGERLLVEVRVEGDRVRLERVVDRVQQAERTLEFSFEQMPGGAGMMLIVKNPLSRTVKYRAGMMLIDDPEDGAVRATSTCPVMPGITAFESWPHPIFQLVLGDFRLQSGASSEMRCD